MPYPYTVTVSGLINAVRQLRSAFPQTVTADTLRKWGIAPNNETYVLNVLKFVGILDAEGKKTPGATKAFAQHGDEQFAAAFAELVENAYSHLFELYGEKAWDLDQERLISFFRSEDETSAIVGKRQAGTFQVLATLAGHEREQAKRPTKPSRPAEKRTRASRPAAKSTRPEVQPKPHTEPTRLSTTTVERGINAGLTVRIEINLPVSEDQALYDKIFRSIRENLLNE